MSKDYNIADEFKIQDLETLKIISHPQRIEILTSLRDPKTVKEIAGEIEADPTKLYYHIRLMEKAKLIQVVETNIVSGIVEKKYLTAASSYLVDDSIFNDPSNEPSQEDVKNLLGAILKTTQTHLNRSINAGLVIHNKEDNQIESHHYLLSEKQLESYFERHKALLEDLKKWSSENDIGDDTVGRYLWTSAFFPLVPKDDEK